MLRVIESEALELEGIFKGHVVQLPCTEQACLQLDQVAQRLIQPDFGCLQERGIYHISGLPVTVLSHLSPKHSLTHSKNELEEE